MKLHTTLGKHKIYLGDSSDLSLLEEGSVQVCVTSPPYWMQREYLDKDDPNKDLEIGREETPEEFIQKLVQIFGQVRRVLHDTATLWVNISDKKENEGFLGIPWRFVFAMQSDRWQFNSDCIWIKLSPMPETLTGWRWERCRKKISKQKAAPNKKFGIDHRSPKINCRPSYQEGFEKAKFVDCEGCKKCNKDGGFVLRKGKWRPCRSHEYLFLFSKSENYYIDKEAVMQPAQESTIMRDRYTRVLDDPEEQYAVKHNHETLSRGKANPKSWMLFHKEEVKEAHYAPYPVSVPAFAIRAGTSRKGQCPKCGTPWARILKDKKTVGWKQCCDCPEHKPVPQTILDPFLGSGTSIVAAERIGRIGIGVELNEEYLPIAVKRIKKEQRNRGFGLRK